MSSRSSEKNSSNTSSGDGGMSTVGPVVEMNCFMSTGVSHSVQAVGSGVAPAMQKWKVSYEYYIVQCHGYLTLDLAPLIVIFNTLYGITDYSLILDKDHP